MCLFNLQHKQIVDVSSMEMATVLVKNKMEHYTFIHICETIYKENKFYLCTEYEYGVFGN